MKPAPFEYFAPTSLEEALALLAQHGDEAKVLAGGQSLIPTMNFRLAQPGVLIDLNRVAELFYIKKNDSDTIQIGAMTRQRGVERNAFVAEHAPLVHETMPYIAHPQIRNRGTFGGSIAHADPASELPAVMTALDARFLLQSQDRERWVPSREFFVDLFMTALEPDELLTAVEIPFMAKGAGWSFQEVARRHGDYALVGVAAVVSLNDNGECSDARIVFLSVGGGPVESVQAAESLKGKKPTSEAIQAAAQIAAAEDIEPEGDIHASAEFRRHLAGVLAERTLKSAFERAQNT